MKNRKIAFISVFTGIFLFGVSMVIIGSTLPVLKERFGMSDVEAGGLFSILPLGLLVGSVAFGPIADKYGYRWVLAVASVLLSLGFLGIAHAGSVNLLRICIFLFGIGGGVMNGASSALVSDLSEKEKKITNLTWLGAFFGIGAFFMPMALSVIDKAYHTLVIDVACVLSLLIAILFAVIAYPVTIQKDKISFRLIPVFFKNKLFIAICLYLFFQSAFEAIVNNWTVSYFLDLNVNEDKALYAFSSSVLGMIVMRVLTGSVLKKMRFNQLMGFALFILAIGLILLILPTPYYLKVAGMFLIGSGLAPGFPVMLGTAGELFKEVSATAFSFAMLVALIGNTLINYTTGVLTEKYGMGVFPYVILTEIIAMILIFMIIRANRNAINTAEK
ncbi:MAG: MFS transporter [Paludibacteraceae bacterium]|nr:MFS transporter [Paludibacteraceae bacterium]